MGGKIGTVAKYVGGIVFGALVGWQISVVAGTIIIVLTVAHGTVKYVKYRKDQRLL
jgi:hypothetical protein